MKNLTFTAEFLSKVLILLIFVTIITSKQYIGEPLSCFCPAHFTLAHIEYTNNICWISNAFYVPVETSFSWPAGPSGLYGKDALTEQGAKQLQQQQLVPAFFKSQQQQLPPSFYATLPNSNISRSSHMRFVRIDNILGE